MTALLRTDFWRGRRRTPRLVRLLAFARVLAILGCFQISGLERVVTEILVHEGVVEIHCDDCEDDTPDDCPPGCPTCHCAGGVLVLPPVAAGELVPHGEARQTLPILDEGRAPAEPDMPHVYRPPRRTSALPTIRIGGGPAHAVS